MVAKVKVDIRGKNTWSSTMFKKNIMKETINHEPCSRNQTLNQTINQTMNRTIIHEPWAKPWTINQGLTLSPTRSSCKLWSWSFFKPTSLCPSPNHNQLPSLPFPFPVSPNSGPSNNLELNIKHQLMRRLKVWTGVNRVWSNLSIGKCKNVPLDISYIEDNQIISVNLRFITLRIYFYPTDNLRIK